MRVLVVEDNPRMAELIRHGLSERGYAVDTQTNGREAEEQAAGGSYDVIILDLLLGDCNGLEICSNLRRRKVSTPILMLTSLSSTNDKVQGLEAGGDDYLTKPFELDELIARIRALLRRSTTKRETFLSVDDVEMDLDKRLVRRAGEEIHLTAREFGLLEYFMRNPGKILSRKGIGQQVWDMNFEDESNVIEVYISRLRSKLDRRYHTPLIHTVAGAGYVFRAGGSPDS